MGRLLLSRSLSGWPHFRGRSPRHARRDPEGPPPARRGGLHFLWSPATPPTRSFLGNEVFFLKSRIQALASCHIRGVWRDKNLDVDPEFEGVTHLMRKEPLRVPEWKVDSKLSQSSRSSSAGTAHLGGPNLFTTLAEDQPRDGAEPGWGQTEPSVTKVSKVQRSEVNVASCRGSLLGGVLGRDSGTEYSDLWGKSSEREESEGDTGSIVPGRGLREKTEGERNFLVICSQTPARHSRSLSWASRSCNPSCLQGEEMASPSRQPPLGGSGLLQGSRARSYGSLVQSACSPVRERRLEHQLAPGDTLAGLALKYGVTVSLPGLECGQLFGGGLFLRRM